LSANWYGSVEDISTIMYKYRIYQNESALGGYVDVGTATSMTNDSYNLIEGTNYSIEVVAYNPSGLNSSGYSDGAWTDFGKPNNVNVTSSSHPVQGTAYSNSTVLLHFNASDVNSSGVMSGIAGYSYLLDKYPGTAPDNDIESREFIELVDYVKGTDWELLYDADSKTSYKTVTTVKKKLLENQSIKVRFALAEMDGETDESVPIEVGLTDEVCTDFASCTFIGKNDTTMDIAYAYSVSNVKVYEVIVKATADVTDSDFQIVIGINSTHTGSKNITIPYSTTTDYQTARCDEGGGSCPQNTTIRYAIEADILDSPNVTQTAQYDNLADGTYYFHVKAIDNAGNPSNTTHFQIVIAGGESIAIQNPVNGQLFLNVNDTMNITATVFVSATSDVKIVSMHPDGSTTNSSQQSLTTSGVFNVTLRQGTNELYAISTTGAKSASVFVILAKEPQGSSNKTIAIRHSGCTTVDSNLCYFTSGGTVVGIAAEEGSAASGVVIGKTESNTMKIFATKAAGFDASKVNADLVDNDFLDQINPMFGFNRDTSKYLIRNDLRYEDIYVSGDVKVDPGKYKLVIIHNGVTKDGKVNVTIGIE